MYVNNELYHHGVLGMKWGVRRYQSYAENPKLSTRQERKAKKAAAKEQYKSRNEQINAEYKADRKKAGLNPLKRGDAKASREVKRIENKAEYYRTLGNERKERRQYINAFKRSSAASRLGELPGAYKNTKIKQQLKENLTKSKGEEYYKKVVRRAVGESIGAVVGGIAAREGAKVLAKKYAQGYVSVKMNNLAVDSLGLNEIEAPGGKKFTSGKQAVDRGKKVLDVLNEKDKW